MPGCCAFDPYTYFENIIIEDGWLEIATAFHLSSYGQTTAIVQKEDSEKNVKQFFNEFKPYIEENSEMPQNIDEVEEDMLLFLFNGPFTFNYKDRALTVDKEIYGNNIFSNFDLLNKLEVFNNQIQVNSINKWYTLISDHIWLLHPQNSHPETIWRESERFARYFVLGKREN